MKLLYVLVLLIFIVLDSFSQDIIFKKNNSDSIKCRIIEDKITSLRYKLNNSNDTTIYEIKQNDYDYYVDKPDELNDVVSSVKSIESTNENLKDGFKTDFGIGLGLDYSGIFGVKYTFFPIKYAAVFISVGYMNVDAGYNVGLQLNILPYGTEFNLRPHIKFMYGANSSIHINGASQYNKVYYGYTYGGGFEFRFGRFKDVGFDIDFSVPLRSNDFVKDYNKILNNKTIIVYNYPPKLTIGIGFHIQL
ncbi:MAG: hypothetical protein A2033_17660 [Bacteroidetes bacterium GWA2_31_9]|nr:MAG: hypothetical protein A2033_17660 [Bacteroidetes bacterium GWA2_31_9]